MVLALASLVCPIPASAQSKSMQKRVSACFLQSLKAQQAVLEKEGREEFVQNLPADIRLQEVVKSADVARYQEMVWAAWCDANRNLQEQKLIGAEDLQLGRSDVWNLPGCLEPNAVMPYYYGRKGEAADGKLPLYLYLHGSGPKDAEWQTGIKLGQSFQDAPSVYFIPQIPNEGEYYRWWHLSKQYAFEKLIRQGLVSGEVDATACMCSASAREVMAASVWRRSMQTIGRLPDRWQEANR